MPFNTYIVTNKINGKQYVGMTTKTVKLRWEKGHLVKAENGSALLLHAEIRKHGKSNFRIRQLGSSPNLKSLREAEKQFIAQYGTFTPKGYNLTLGGNGGCGYKFTEEQLRQLSKSHLGCKHTEESKKKIGQASKGRVHSAVVKEKMSQIQKAVWLRPGYKEKMSQSMKRSRQTETAKEKATLNFAILMQDSKFKAKWTNPNAGRKHSFVSRERMRLSHLGKRPSQESIEKMRISQRSKIFTLEHRKNISAAHKKRWGKYTKKERALIGKKIGEGMKRALKEAA